MVKRRRSESSNTGDEVEPDLPRFVLIARQDSAENHALAPGADRGPALCGMDEPPAGWLQTGSTDRLFRIDCHTCRRAAAALLSALSKQEGQGDAASL